MSKSNVRTSVTVSERRRLVPNPLGNVETKSWTCRKKKWQFENSNFEFKFRTVSKRQIVQKISLKIWIWIQILIRPKLRLFLVHMPNTEDQNKNAAPGRGWTARRSLSEFAYRGDISITSTCFACWPTTRGKASRRLVRKTWEMAAAWSRDPEI